MWQKIADLLFKPCNWIWFQTFIAWLRIKSPWFNTWGYGYSKDLQDFVHNPFERFRDEKFPCCIKNVEPKAYLFQYKFFPYQDRWIAWYANFSKVASTYHKIYPSPKWEKVWNHADNYKISSLVIDKWVTKYPNATFMLQLIISWKYGFIPILFASCNIRINELTYWQFGAGWGPQWVDNYDQSKGINAVMCGKFRYVKYADESARNPSDVYGYFEGDV
jgi:hypothetical protein